MGGPLRGVVSVEEGISPPYTSIDSFLGSVIKDKDHMEIQPL